MTVTVGKTYLIGGQTKFPHRVMSIEDHPQNPSDKLVVTKIVRADGFLGTTGIRWSLEILESRIVEET
ncbi:hypothetical protein [Bradyrhizobium liaoningense]